MFAVGGDMKFTDWRAEADHKMKAQFGIDLQDTGLSAADLQKAWAQDLSPSAFVEWTGEKFDLRPAREWGWN